MRLLTDDRLFALNLVLWPTAAIVLAIALAVPSPQPSSCDYRIAITDEVEA